LLLLFLSSSSLSSSHSKSEQSIDTDTHTFPFLSGITYCNRDVLSERGVIDGFTVHLLTRLAPPDEVSPTAAQVINTMF
jgi:hypothetical protein